MLAARCDDRGVDLIRHHANPVALGKCDDRRELLARMHGAGRVVRAAQQERGASAALGGGAERAIEGTRVDPVPGAQRCFDHTPLNPLDEAVKRCVHG